MRVRVFAVVLLCVAFTASSAIVLRKGDRSMEVELLARVLNAYTAGSDNVEQLQEGNEFTEEVEKRVRDFQTHFALTADGVVGSKTFGVMLPTLGKGRVNRPQFVRVLQWYLKRKFQADVDINGQADEHTLAAITKVQQQLNTAADGIVGRGTWRRMMEMSGEGAVVPEVGAPLVLRPRGSSDARNPRRGGGASDVQRPTTPEGLSQTLSRKYTAMHRESVSVPVTFDAYVRKDARCNAPVELTKSPRCSALKYAVPSNWEALFDEGKAVWDLLRQSWDGELPAGTPECQQALETYRCQTAVPKCGAFGVLGVCQVSCEDFYATCFPAKAAAMQAKHCVHLKTDRSECGYARMYRDQSAASLEGEFTMSSPLSASKADLGDWVSEDKRFGILRSGVYNIAVRVVRADAHVKVTGNALSIKLPNCELMATLDYWVSHPLFDEAASVRLQMKASLEAHASGIAGEEPVVDKADFDMSTLKAHFSNGLMSEVKAQMLELIKPMLLEHMAQYMPAAVQVVLDGQLNPHARDYMYTDNSMDLEFDGKLMFTNPSDGTLSALPPQ